MNLSFIYLNDRHIHRIQDLLSIQNCYLKKYFNICFVERNKINMKWNGKFRIEYLLLFFFLLHHLLFYIDNCQIVSQDNGGM